MKTNFKEEKDVDELRIRSDILKGLISRIVKKSVRKKIGADVDLQIHYFDIVIKDGRVKIDMSLEAETDMGTITKLIDKGL